LKGGIVRAGRAARYANFPAEPESAEDASL
jgi:hypothetical protein